MNDKYISVWIWLVSGIIAVTVILIGNKFVVNPEKSWTLKTSEFPTVRQKNLETDFELRKIDEPINGRTVTDPIWKNVSKFDLNQISLPEKPVEPKGPDKPVVPITKPPTFDEAKADLEKRIKINGVFSPISAKAQILDPNMEVVLIPYTRLNPHIKEDIQLSQDYNIYDDLTEIGLQARCIEVRSEGVVFDYTYSKGIYSKTFRILLKFEIELSIENLADDNQTYKNKHNHQKNDKLNISKLTHIDENGVVLIGRDDNEKLSKNFEREISRYGFAIVRNTNTGEIEGVILNRVPDDSLAQKAGFEKNDVIISVNSHPVHSVSDAISWVKSNPEEFTYVVKYNRNGNILTRIIKNPNN